MEICGLQCNLQASLDVDTKNWSNMSSVNKEADFV